jgi:DNA adenine methylase
MFFYLGPERAEISDASAPLIETYKAVKKSPETIIKFVRHLNLSKAEFERVKRYSPRSRGNKAARFIFLNKACWNGLFRVNSEGIFNVPYGWPKSNFILDEGAFADCCSQLRRRGVTIRCQDFSEIESRVVKGDFVFLDPPYVTSHNMNGFADWNESLFSWSDQQRLAEMAHRLVKRGANVLVTNANHHDIRQLYSCFGHSRFDRFSTLAGDTTKRRLTSEAIFYGGPAYATLDVAATKPVDYEDGSYR